MKDYRVKVKVRNNRILTAIEEIGGQTGQVWCVENGLQYSTVNDFINMTTSPLCVNGKLKLQAAKLCDVLGKLPEDLWSNEQLYPLEKNFSEMEMDYSQIISMLPSGEQSYLHDFSEMEELQKSKLIDSALSTLKDIEKSVIKMRFYEDMTMAECGKNLGVTPARIMQIESKALRKLRHPTRIDIFVDAIDIDEELRKKHEERMDSYRKAKEIEDRKNAAYALIKPIEKSTRRLK